MPYQAVFWRQLRAGHGRQNCARVACLRAVRDLQRLDAFPGLCSLDQTEAAFRSEDFPGDRWSFQLDVMEALAERLHLQDDLCRDAAHLAGRHCAFEQQHSICALSASRAKLLCPPARLSDRAQCMAALRGMLPDSRNSSASLTSVLRLAAVGPFAHPTLHGRNLHECRTSSCCLS